MNCINCSKETNNPKFCSRSCAAIVTNKLFPKKKLTRVCLECDNKVFSFRHSRCENHWKYYKENSIRNKTLSEYTELLSVKGKHPSWKHTHVRALARSWLKHLTTEPCRHCGYTKHVELAHIKAVSSFGGDAKLSEVNSESNVIPLCPNCHWEFDNLPRLKADALSC